MLVLLLLLAAAALQAAAQTPATVAGWAEYVWFELPRGNVRLRAKLDTGAQTSSIGVANLKDFSRDDAPWISFDLAVEGTGTYAVEAPVVRTARIRRAGTRVQERPVIMLRACVAGMTRETEFTVAERQGMEFPVLIGRKFLAGAILVDSTAQFSAPDSCAASEPAR